MNAKKFLATSLTALMSISLLAGCGGSSNSTATQGSTGGSEAPAGGTETTESEAVTLTVWTPAEDQSDDQGNWLNKQLTAFQEAHPEWTIEFKTGVCSEGDAGTTVPQDAEAAADVYMFANDQLPNLIEAGALAELGGSTLDDIKARNSEKAISYLTYDGGVYGVPFTTNTWFMYYDKRVFSEDDVKSLDTMLEKGVVAYPLTTAWYFAAPYLANGCTMFGADGTDNDAGIQFNGEAGAQVTDALVDLVANPNFKNDADGLGIAGLADGSVNAIFSGSWDYTNVVNALGAENVGIATAPTMKINGADKQLLSFAGVKGIGVNPHSKNMQAAVALASFLGSTQAQMDHYELRATVPTDTTIDIPGDMLVKAQNDTINSTSFPQPFVPGMSKFWDPAATMGSAIVNGEVTHANAAEMTEATNGLYNSSAVD